MFYGCLFSVKFAPLNLQGAVVLVDVVLVDVVDLSLQIMGTVAKHGKTTMFYAQMIQMILNVYRFRKLGINRVYRPMSNPVKSHHETNLLISNIMMCAYLR